MAAGFREIRRLEDFDFSFNPSIKKDRVFDLATCKFIRERRDALLVGPPGTGKSHLVQAIGLAAIRSGFTVFYRSIFDTVRDFLHDEALAGQENPAAVPQTGPADHRRHGHEGCPSGPESTCSKSCCVATRSNRP